MESVAGIVRLRPRGDILPVRAKYSEGPTTNIALCMIRSGLDTDYTIADAVGSFLLNGRMPEILEVVTLHPHGRAATTPKVLFGDDRYVVNPAVDGIFTRLIDLRSEIKEAGKTAPAEQKELYDARQEALKLVANSTSHGALVEYVDEERAKPRWATVYTANNPEGVRVRARKTEKAGAYFAGPVGALIPAAGRLLLSIAERLAADRGIEHVFCDTDSMCFARPEQMDFAAFESKVREIIDWFTPLSPYSKPGSILEIEENTAMGPGYYCFAISAKRYCVFRFGDFAKGEPRIVFTKISSHGTGAMRDPEGYQSIFADAPSIEARCAVVTNKAAACIIYDMWREAIECVLDGKPIPADRPYLERYRYFNKSRLNTRRDMELYQAFDWARPFAFGSYVPGIVYRAFDARRIGSDRLKELTEGGFAGPHASSFDEIESQLYIRKSGKPLNLSLPERALFEFQEGQIGKLRWQTLEDVVAHHFEHPESKADPPTGIGALNRREVVIAVTKFIGKETPAVAEEIEDYDEHGMAEYLDGRAVVDGSGSARKPHPSRNGKVDLALVDRMRAFPAAELARVSGIVCRVVKRWRNGERAVFPETLPAIEAALAKLERKAAVDPLATQADRLRKRIKALNGGDELNGYMRLRKIVPDPAPFKRFYLGERLPTPEQLAVWAGYVSECEGQDGPVGPITISGSMEHVIYREPGGWGTIFAVLPDQPGLAPSGSETITVAGNTEYAGCGLRVTVEGEWLYHDEHGPRVRARTITVSLPEDEAGIKRYIADTIKGIGPALAFKLTHRFGTGLPDMARSEPDRLSVVVGLTTDARKRLAQIAAWLSEPLTYETDEEAVGAGDSDADVSARAFMVPSHGAGDAAFHAGSVP